MPQKYLERLVDDSRGSATLRTAFMLKASGFELVCKPEVKMTTHFPAMLIAQSSEAVHFDGVADTK